MPDLEKLCTNCFWAWPDGLTLRCTRLPPLPVNFGKTMPDTSKEWNTYYVPCPIVPGCGEWREIIIEQIDIPEEAFEPQTELKEDEDGE